MKKFKILFNTPSGKTYCTVHYKDIDQASNDIAESARSCGFVIGDDGKTALATKYVYAIMEVED